MSRVWIVLALVGAATVALKAAGPVLVGSRELPARVATAYWDETPRELFDEGPGIPRP